LPTQYANPAPINQGGLPVPQTGLIGSEQALIGGFTGAMDSMNQGQAGAEQLLGRTAQQGQGASDIQAALSGASGKQAQDAAYANFQNSPAMKYQMDQMQRATERSAAARGGLLGGNTLKALQENAAGIASQDFQNQFNNLGAVSDRGTQLQMRLADLRSNLGLNKGALFTGTGDRLASGRMNAGLAIAQNAQNTASGISNLLANQGVQVSDQMGKDISTMSSLIHESGMQDKIDNANLATILANIAGGQASNIMQANTNIGEAKAAGIMGQNAALQGGLTQAIQLGAFSPKSPSQPVSGGGSVSDYTGSQYSNWARQQ
jgi:hypothetical protein